MKVYGFLTLFFAFCASITGAAVVGTATVAASSRSADCLRVLKSSFLTGSPSLNLDSADDGVSTNIGRPEAVVSALKELLRENVITPQDLPAILRGENPLTKQSTSSALEFREVIDRMIVAIEADHDQMAPLVQKLIDENSQSFSARTDREIKTKDKFTQLAFYPVEPGSFIMGSPSDERGYIRGEERHQVTIEREFWVANFPVTQWQYAMVMGNNPSRFRTGVGAIEFETETVVGRQVIKSKISMRPNNPIEGLLAAEENQFIEKMNELSKNDDPLIYQIIPDHQKYWSYRKPTEEEWEYVARNRGVWKGLYPDGISAENVGRIAWYDKNSDGQTHPVGELEPILIDGKYSIYDLYGNVWERMSNEVIRGGGCLSFSRDLNATEFSNTLNRIIGFRLVQTPPPPRL